MSDYLSRLAERALGQTSFVAPLVRSRYGPTREPELASEDRSWTAALRGEAGQPDAPRAALADAPPATEEIVDQSAPPAAAIPPSREGPSLGATSPRRQPPLAVPALPAEHPADEAPEPPPSRGRRTAARPSLPRGQKEPPRIHLHARSPVIPEPHRRRAGRVGEPAPEPADEHPAEGRELEPTLGPPAIQAREPERLARPPAPARRRDSPTAPTQRAPLVDELPTPPRLLPAPSWSARDEPSPVQVTIGRVEVRAPAPPPAPVPAAAPDPGPALSLDEYLRTRGGVAS
jgi:hypothetical protein